MSVSAAPNLVLISATKFCNSSKPSEVATLTVSYLSLLFSASQEIDATTFPLPNFSIGKVLCFAQLYTSAARALAHCNSLNTFEPFPTLNNTVGAVFLISSLFAGT